MKHVFSTSCVVLLSLLMLVTSCKKGDTGPEGPAGPDGPQGPQGPQGPPGSANVIYSNWLDVEFDAQTNQAGDTLYFYYATVDIPKLTNTILSQGITKAYINWGTPDAPEIDPLPLLDPIFGISITTTFSAGQVLFLANDDYGTYTGTSDSKKHNTFRYVLVPGGVPARSAINWNDYASVKKYLNIAD